MKNKLFLLAVIVSSFLPLISGCVDNKSLTLPDDNLQALSAVDGVLSAYNSHPNGWTDDSIWKFSCGICKNGQATAPDSNQVFTKEEMLSRDSGYCTIPIRYHYNINIPQNANGAYCEAYVDGVKDTNSNGEECKEDIEKSGVSFGTTCNNYDILKDHNVAVCCVLWSREAGVSNNQICKSVTMPSCDTKYGNSL